MRHGIALVGLLAAAACAPQQGVQSATPAADAYHPLLARLKAGDTTLDVTAVRLAYAASPDYSPYGSDADDHRDSMNAALGREDYKRAVIEADSALNIDYLDIRTHVMKAYAAEHLGDSSTALSHRVIAGRLFESIMKSGLGTADSPYVVITVAEEYAVLGMSGYQRGMQSLSECGPRHRRCDILETTHRETNEKRTFHFDITLPMKYMEQRLH